MKSNSKRFWSLCRDESKKIYNFYQSWNTGLCATFHYVLWNCNLIWNIFYLFLEYLSTVGVLMTVPCIHQVPFYITWHRGQITARTMKQPKSRTPHASTWTRVANPSPEQLRLCKVDDRERERMKDEHAHSSDTQRSTRSVSLRDPVRPTDMHLPVPQTAYVAYKTTSYFLWRRKLIILNSIIKSTTVQSHTRTRVNYCLTNMYFLFKISQ